MCEVLLTSIQEDFDGLIYKYSLLRSYDFEDFTKIWNDMKFYYVYCGRPTELEMRFFTQNVLLFAKNMILNKGATEWERVGALYLLHCLYYTQPLLKPVDIRINHVDLKALVEFVESVRVNSFDPVYALMKLCFDHAFHFVYCDIPKTIEKAGKVDFNALSMLNDEAELKEQRQCMIDLIKKAKIDEQEWRSVENDYNDSMVKLSQMTIGPSKLNFTPSDFFKDILFPEKNGLPGSDGGETSQGSKTSQGGTKRRKQRLLKMMVEGLLTKDDDGDEGPNPDGESLPMLDSTLDA
ncbi:snRNA-activating protein complex subunit 1 [Halyomorpha halys]|uniref:snRNA-activating protein complex subunit 1 n=1 Tax=Halyomorpha halys TaxID=286706 RepID=UPI0006D505D4|nr:snRNA-activating protein complex subunit 1-like [Halyomorpha halys]